MPSPIHDMLASVEAHIEYLESILGFTVGQTENRRLFADTPDGVFSRGVHQGQALVLTELRAVVDSVKQIMDRGAPSPDGTGRFEGPTGHITFYESLVDLLACVLDTYPAIPDSTGSAMKSRLMRCGERRGIIDITNKVLVSLDSSMTLTGDGGRMKEAAVNDGLTEDEQRERNAALFARKINLALNSRPSDTKKN